MIVKSIQRGRFIFSFPLTMLLLLLQWTTAQGQLRLSTDQYKLRLPEGEVRFVVDTTKVIISLCAFQSGLPHSPTHQPDVSTGDPRPLEVRRDHHRIKLYRWEPCLHFWRFPLCSAKELPVYRQQPFLRC